MWEGEKGQKGTRGFSQFIHIEDWRESVYVLESKRRKVVYILNKVIHLRRILCFAYI